MAPQPRAQTSPPKPWEHRISPPDRALAATAPAVAPNTGMGGGGAPYAGRSGALGGAGAGTGTPARPAAMGPTVAAAGRGPTNAEYSRRNGGSADSSSRYPPTQQGSNSAGARGVTARSIQGVPATGVGAGAGAAATGQGKAGEGTGAVSDAGAQNGLLNGSTNGAAGGQQWKQQGAPGMQGPTGAYGGGYGGGGYGAGRYGAGTGMTTSYGAGGLGSTYGSAFGGGGYGGYGGYGGGMYGGGYGGGYGSSYAGNRYGMGGMGMGGMGAMGGMHDQYSWLHSIQHFTTSLGYLTEMLGMNTQAIGFVFGNLMGFLEHIGNSLTSIQPWREFPPGHPRHGEPPPTPEEERRRLSRLRVLRFALTILIAYAGFRLSRALHRLLTSRRGERPRAAIAQSSLEDIYRHQGQSGVLDRGRRPAGAMPWEGGAGTLNGLGRRNASSGRHSGAGYGAATDFDGVDPWKEF